MPYGLPKSLNDKKNNKWMEDCVEGVLRRGKGVDKVGAIRICKKNIIEKSGSTNRANIGVINDLLELYSEERKKK